MASNERRLPIKIVRLQDDDLQAARPGGSDRKVFDQADLDEKRESILGQIADVRRKFGAVIQPRSNLPAVARVVLKDQALAKSHRPSHLFDRNSCPIIGGEDFGHRMTTPHSLIIAAAACAMAWQDPPNDNQIAFMRDGELQGSPFLVWDDASRTFWAGDWVGTHNHAAIFIDDTNGCVNLQALGPIVIGDEGWANATRLIIDDRFSEIVSDAPLYAKHGLYLKDHAGGWWKVEVSTNGTLSTSQAKGPVN